MNAAEFRKDRERRNAIAVVTATWDTIATHLNNSKYGEALVLLTEVEPTIEQLGEDFIMGHWPVCRPCGGTAEVPDPDNAQGRKLVCYIETGDVAAGSHCRGNRYGRMHPVQLREYIEALVAGQAPAALPEGDGLPPLDLAEQSRREAVVALMDAVEACEPCRVAKQAAGVLCPEHHAQKEALEAHGAKGLVKTVLGH